MTIKLSRSRAYPAHPADAFDTVLEVPLPTLFARRYAAIPPVREVRDQSGTWGSVGAARTIVPADGGTLVETLTSVDRPHTFGYHLSEVTDAAAAGRRGRRPVRLRPGRYRRAGDLVMDRRSRGRLGALAMPLFARMWRGYARQALEVLESVLTPPTQP